MIINTMKLIEETRGKINLRYEMYQKNILDISRNNLHPSEMIIDGFIFGYAQGFKACKAEMKKKAVK